MAGFLAFADTEESRYAAAERFVEWLEHRATLEARGDEYFSSEVDPTGRFWLGRLGPMHDVMRSDERGDRLEPCAIGFRFRPQSFDQHFTAKVRCILWLRERAPEDSAHRWSWRKSDPVSCEIGIPLSETPEDHYGRGQLSAAIGAVGGLGLQAEIRVKLVGRGNQRAVEVTFVNSTPEDVDTDNLGDGRLFECSMEVSGFSHRRFELDALPDSFRYDRNVEAFGLNCGIEFDGATFRTTDAPSKSRNRPIYWAFGDNCPNLTFNCLANDPLPSCEALLKSFNDWSRTAWTRQILDERSISERWSPEMRAEAERAAGDFYEELDRITTGVSLLASNEDLKRAFMLMNEAMSRSARGRYDSWRPFQLAFLLANLLCLVDTTAEAEIVDIVWFATGGGKTETYLGLLITAAILDRLRGKHSGITAWSRFPLRLLSLQQTQRFANAIAAAETVRKLHGIGGDPFALGFLVGGTATPNRIKKEATREGEWDADKVDDLANPFLLLDACPICRQRTVSTRFDRVSWRLLHLCSNSDCESAGGPLPIYVIDDEIWRFLPTVVVGTLDKAANIARQPGMRGLVGSPWGKCTKPGHGFTYARRSDRKNGCLVPDCQGGAPDELPLEAGLYAPSFRLQDELHLLRDSLGAVDAHYEAALDSIQQEISGSKPKILASSATLAGYQKQVSVLYRRRARVFPQAPPREGQGFWTSDSPRLMRKYVALAPRRLTVEFAVDRLVVTLQKSIRDIISEPSRICSELNIAEEYADFLVNLYGTNVVYGNTLQDLDAVVRSSETQYAGLEPPPNVETLTGRTAFEDVRSTLGRLENPEARFEERLHLIAASSMMSHGVDIDRLNVMIMLALPLGVAEFIQATARVGRRWPSLVFVVPKMTRERDASVYRAFPQFISHGDRFVEAIPITRKSRRVLERTIAGLELARMHLVHEPTAASPLTTPRNLNAFIRDNPNTLANDRRAIAESLELSDLDEFLFDQLGIWFEGFARNLREPTADIRFLSDLSPTGQPMLSLRDVEEQSPVSGDSLR